MKIENVLILNKDFQFMKGKLSCENGIFTAIEETDADAENYVIPGLVDIHAHGCGGLDVMELDYEGFNKMSEIMAKSGTTTVLPTLLTDTRERIFNAAVMAWKSSKKGVSGANIPGVHLEGPFFGKECIGSNNAAYIRNPDIDEIEKIQTATNGFVKIISMDPVLPGSDAFIEHFCKDINISLGHTDADFEAASHAIHCGARNITHTFNGMKSMHHREPNMLGAAFNSDVFMELICDGFHVNPEMVKIAYRLTGKDRMVFISDSCFMLGMPEGIYHSCGQTCIVSGGRALLEDGTIYGGMTALYDCVLKAVSYGIPFHEAVKCATINPAKAAGISDKYGSIDLGKQADFLVVDKNFHMKAVYVKGVRING